MQKEQEERYEQKRLGPGRRLQDFIDRSMCRETCVELATIKSRLSAVGWVIGSLLSALVVASCTIIVQNTNSHATLVKLEEKYDQLNDRVSAQRGQMNDMHKEISTFNLEIERLRHGK